MPVFWLTQTHPYLFRKKIFGVKFVFLLVSICLLPAELFAQEAPAEKNIWKSSISLSYVTAAGNSSSQTLSIAADANRKDENSELELKAGTVSGRTNGVKTTEYWYGDAKYSHNITPKLYWFSLLGVMGNKPSGYNLRLTFNPGIGYRFLEGRHELKGEIGPGYFYEDRILGDDLSFVSGRAYALYKFHITENSEFSQDAEYLHHFSDASDYRISTNTGLLVKISQYISLKTGVTVQYTHKPPEDKKSTDVFTTTSLVFTF